MNIKIYGTPGEFLEDNKAFLQRFEAVCQLNLGNAQATKNEPCRPDLLFGRCEEEGRGVLLFGNLLPYNLCLNAIPGDFSALSAAVLLAEYLRREKIEVKGVNASKVLCNAFFSAYGGSYRVRAGMDIMVLKELIEPPVVPGKLRPAEEEDVSLITNWHRAFYREALHEEPPEDVEDRVRAHIGRHALFVWENPEREAVSAAHICARELEHGASISGVYTPPEQRGKGYCQNTVAAICRKLLTEGKEYCTLFVDKANPVSNRVYEKIGFQIVEDNFDCRLEKA